MLKLLCSGFVLLSLMSLSAFAATFYVDPLNGEINNDGSRNAPWRTLAEVFANDLVESFTYQPLPFEAGTSTLVVKHEGAPVKSGDTLVLRNGLHGTLLLRNFNNSEFVTIIAEDGHTPVLERVQLTGCKNWRLQGLTISGEPYNSFSRGRLIYLERHGFQGPCSKIDIVDCEIFSADEPWTEAADWSEKASEGIHCRADSVNMINNRIRNVRMGIQAIGDYCNAIGNQIVNFSGDGMRVLGSNILFEANLIKNCYNVDENHDDGIQSFNIDQYTVDNVILRGNTIINNEDPNQPLAGPLQGMGFFDGPYNNWIVENNLIVVDHWHGITFMGGRQCIVRNNTVLDPTPDVRPGPSWIRIDPDKDGTPSVNCIVSSNVAHSFPVTGGVEHNNISLATTAEYSRNFVNWSEFDFRLLPESRLIDAGHATDFASEDMDGNRRPQGASADAGCFEFVAVSTDVVESGRKAATPRFEIYPNPATDLFVIYGDLNGLQAVVVNLDGRAVQHYQASSAMLHLNISELPAGMYFVQLRDGSGSTVQTSKLLKH